MASELMKCYVICDGKNALFAYKSIKYDSDIDHFL